MKKIINNVSRKVSEWVERFNAAAALTYEERIFVEISRLD